MIETLRIALIIGYSGHLVFLICIVIGLIRQIRKMDADIKERETRIRNIKIFVREENNGSTNK